MFSATIGGLVKRVISDNGKDDEKAHVCLVLEVKKQFVKKDEMPYIYPMVKIFGHDAQYFRDYAGAGHYLTAINCEMESWRGKDDDEEEKISFKAGKIVLLPKHLTDQLEIEEEDDRKSRKNKNKSKGKDERGSGKSRSERRGRRDEDEDEDDDDDEDEDEAPRRRKSSSSKSKPSSKDKGKSSSKKNSSSSSKKKSRDDDDDDDLYDDDDDDLYDDED